MEPGLTRVRVEVGADRVSVQQHSEDALEPVWKHFGVVLVSYTKPRHID